MHEYITYFRIVVGKTYMVLTVATDDFVGGLCVLAWHAGCPCYAVINTAQVLLYTTRFSNPKTLIPNR